MKQSVASIGLRDYVPSAAPWGNELGRRVNERLRAAVERSLSTIFAISLRGIEKTDASFPREAVVELTLHFRMQRGFYLIDVDDADLIDNWDAAAARRSQPLLVWTSTPPLILGPQPGEGTRVMLDYVLPRGAVTAGEAARALDIKVPNASNKLKELWEEGYVLRRERTAPTGGVEFEYVRIY